MRQVQTAIAIAAGASSWDALIQGSAAALRLALSLFERGNWQPVHPWVKRTLIDEPWAVARWAADFDWRDDLGAELRILELAFPGPFRERRLNAMPPRHPLAYDLISLGSRARLLELASELRRNMPAHSSDVPMAGRLQDARLYGPTVSEMLVAAFLRPLGGELVWQPEGNRPGCDYRVEQRRSWVLAEVKSMRRAERINKEENRRIGQWLEAQTQADLADEGLGVRSNNGNPSDAHTDSVSRPIPLFSEPEQLANAQMEAQRLYRHVRKAAVQLGVSATHVAGRRDRQGIAKILFLDVQANSTITHVKSRVASWLTLNWATSIDLIILFDYRPREGRWGLIAQPLVVPGRTDRASQLFADALPTCEQGHFHVPAYPIGRCDLPFGF